MKPASLKSFTIVFIIIVTIELICDHIDIARGFHYATKPLIVISLLWFFIRNGKGLSSNTTKLTIAALCFSLLGDVFLMLVDTSPHFFMIGLICFLIAHIMYVLVFRKSMNKSIKPYLFIILLCIYAFGLFSFLKDGLGELLIPVVVYMLVILAMATFAYIRKGQVSIISYKMVLLGAILFMISDSILALNKFVEPINYSGILIMLTYAFAQYFIIIGLLKQHEELPPKRSNN